MHDYTILFAGPAGAGKTTAIASISETVPTAADLADVDSAGAPGLVLESGQLTLDNGDRLWLLGAPGHARCDALQPVLAANALGLVILLDNARADPLADLAYYLDGFAAQLAVLPCAVAVGRLPEQAKPDLDDYAQFLHLRGLVLPVLACDVRRRADIVTVLETLLAQVEAFNLGPRP